MGIELPPELADVAAQTGVAWPQADEEAMARQAQAWRDAATSMSTVATDADTTARAALSTIAGETAEAASKEWKTFVEPDSGHLTSVVRDCNAAADRLEHAATQVGTAKVEIVRNLVTLAQNQDAANAAAQAGHPFALAGMDTAVQGTAANVAHIESQLVSAVQPTSTVDMATVQNPVNANPGHHLQPGITTGATNLVTQTVADTPLAAGPSHSDGQPPQSVGDLVRQTTGNATDLVRHGSGDAADLVHHGGVAVGDTADQVLPGHPGPPGDVLPGRPDAGPGHGDGRPDGPNAVLPQPGDVLPARPDLLPADPEITGRVPADAFPVDAPTPPTGQTVQAGFAGGLEAAAAPAPAANLPPAMAAPPLNPAAPAYGGVPGFTGAPLAPPLAAGAPAIGAAPPPAAAPAVPPARLAPFAPVAPAVPASPAAPAGPVAPVAPGAPASPVAADRPQDPAPRKPLAGPPGAPPPAKGERNDVLVAFWLHMFPIGHLPVASYRPARQLPPPPEELDYAAGLRFEPGDHPRSDLVDPTSRLAEIREVQRKAEEAAAEPPSHQPYAPLPGPNYPPAPPANPAEAVAAGYPPAPLPEIPAPAAEPQTAPPPVEPVPKPRPITSSAGLTADHPTVQGLLENHDPLGGSHERDWDRRYLVRLGSVTAHGISPEGLEYNWPVSLQYPEGGSAPGEPEVLAEGAVIDRFGTPHGRVFAQDGTPFAQRSLPPPHKDTGYRRYKVTKALPVWRAVSAAWFGQPGGGVRYRTTHSAAELVALGYLEEIA